MKHLGLALVGAAILGYFGLVAAFYSPMFAWDWIHGRYKRL